MAGAGGGGGGGCGAALGARAAPVRGLGALLPKPRPTTPSSVSSRPGGGALALGLGGGLAVAGGSGLASGAGSIAGGGIASTISGSGTPSLGRSSPALSSRSVACFFDFFGCAGVSVFSAWLVSGSLGASLHPAIAPKRGSATSTAHDSRDIFIEYLFAAFVIAAPSRNKANPLWRSPWSRPLASNLA